MKMITVNTSLTLKIKEGEDITIPQQHFFSADAPENSIQEYIANHMISNNLKTYEDAGMHFTLWETKE